MGAFEYLLLFAAVIMGLAASDIAISLHRLLNAGRRVTWDALPLLAALLAFEKITVQWWGWYQAKPVAEGLTFGMFSGVLVQALLLFLMSAAALPDEIGAEGVDLRAHYVQVQRRYWLLFAGHWFVANLVSIWTQMAVQGAKLTLASPVYLILPAALSLAVFRSRWFQTLGLVGFIALYIAVDFNQTLR